MFLRTDTSILGQWWWTIDRWILISVLSLLSIGILLVVAASPSVAETINLSPYYFVKRHFIYIIPSLALIVGVSLLSPDSLKKFSIVLFCGCILALFIVPFLGAEIKGARRWLNLGILSLQPSEFIKPAFALLSAWLFTLHKSDEGFPGNQVCIGLYTLVMILLFLQPDFGMVLLISAVWFGQFFLSGLPLLWIGSGAVFSLVAFGGAYLFLPHVNARITRFFGSGSVDKFGEGYQISQSLEAFARGGFLGQGPGEGFIKKNLPDAHADFIFAVAAEEFGLLLCFLIIALFAVIIVRGFSKALKENDLFILLAVAGLLAQFGLQALINIASTIHLIPTKGMTLPLISYGGSSLLSISILLGMVLGLTRRRVYAKGFIE